MTPETEVLTEEVSAFPADATCAAAEETGAVTRVAVPVTEDVRALPVVTAWLPADDTEEAALAGAEVAG